MRMAETDQPSFAGPAAQGSMNRARQRYRDRQTAQRTSLVEREELIPVFGFTIRQAPAQRILRQRTMLKAPLGKHGHFDAGDRGDSPRDNFAFQFVEASNIVLRQLDEWNRFRNAYNAG